MQKKNGRQIRCTERTTFADSIRIAILTSVILLVSLPANAAGRLTDFQCLVEAIYYEIGWGNMEERLAVGAVVLNRVNFSNKPTTICAVVHASTTREDGRKVCAFSYHCSPSRTYHNISNQYIKQMCEYAALAAIEGAVPAGLSRAVSFHNDSVSPNWSRTLRFVRKIGPHLFYEVAQ